MKRGVGNTFKMLAVTAAYILTAVVSIQYFSLANSNACPVWFASGVALAGMFWCDTRLTAVAVWFGAFSANIIGFMVVAAPAMNGLTAFPLSALIACGNTVEAMAAHYIFKRMDCHRFANWGQSFLFFLVVAASCAISATNGVVWLRTFRIIPGELTAYVWRTWWTGDNGGIITLFPALMCAFQWDDSNVHSRWFYIPYLLAFVAVVSWVFLSSQYTNLFFLVGMLVLCPLLFGPRLGILTLCLGGIVGLYAWQSSLSRLTDIESNSAFLIFQNFLLASGAIVYLIIGIRNSEASAMEALAEANHELKHKVDRQTYDIRRNAARLAVQNAEQQRIITAISHDMKGPLQSTVNFMKSQDMEHPAWQQVLGYVEKMFVFVADVEEYSMLSKGEPVIEETKLKMVFDQCIRLNQSTIDEKNALVRLATAVKKVTCDRNQMRQLLSNLINNALKYNDKERPWIVVRCERRDAERDWLFRVEDNGIGIAPKNLEQIFEMFFRVDNNRMGAGMGLSMCRDIVSAHGGRIWCESQIGVGSTFFFTIPFPNGG